MRIPTRTALLLLLLLPAAVLWGCQDNPTGGQTGTVQVRMTDAPGDFDAVNIVITEVSLHRSGEADPESGWEVLTSESATYDLLTLQNGVFTTIAHTTALAGPYDQVRLKVGEGSTVVVDGVSHPLTIPSGSQSGIKLVGSFEVPPNGLLDLLLDFDASQSIVLTGNGDYMLKPVIHVMPFSTAGSISGVVVPATAGVTVRVMSGTEIVGTATTNELGQFTVSALPAGTYTVVIDPATTYQDNTLANVTVTAGVTTTVGNVVLVLM